MSISYDGHMACDLPPRNEDARMVWGIAGDDENFYLGIPFFGPRIARVIGGR